jgi:hypothetical protein
MLDAIEVVADKVECFGDPRMGVPIMLLLSLHLREVP